MKTIAHRAQAAMLLLLLFSPLVRGAEPQVNGQLETFGHLPALRVWGTPQEMGLAHGYLLADNVVAGMSFDRRGLSSEEQAVADGRLRQFVTMIKVPPRIREELEGMLAGVQLRLGEDAGKKELGRPLVMDDLVFWTAFDAARAFGCSGFTVWGEKAGDAGVITTRNFDFDLLSDDMLDQQVLLIREPAGRRKVALVTLAGYIGAYTGVNEDGVCSFIHDGSGRGGPAGFTSITPLIPALTDWLESTTTKNAAASAESMLNDFGRYPFSYMVRVVTPRVGSAPAERTFRIDAMGVRENDSANGVCITTNHYVLAGLEPDGGAHPWSLKRYERLREGTEGSVSPANAWKAMESVTWSDARTGTLHTAVVYPELRKMDLAFAAMESGKLVPATKRPRVTITFDELFNRSHP